MPAHQFLMVHQKTPRPLPEVDIEIISLQTILTLHINGRKAKERVDVNQVQSDSYLTIDEQTGVPKFPFLGDFVISSPLSGWFLARTCLKSVGHTC